MKFCMNIAPLMNVINLRKKSCGSLYILIFCRGVYGVIGFFFFFSYIIGDLLNYLFLN